MKYLLSLVVLFAVVMGLKFRAAGKDSDAILAEMKSVIVELEIYDANAEFIDGLLERHHTIAFNDAYTTGRRRQRATFDNLAYVDLLLDRMIDDCKMLGKKDIAEAFVELRSLMKQGLTEMEEQEQEQGQN